MAINTHAGSSFLQSSAIDRRTADRYRVAHASFAIWAKRTSSASLSSLDADVVDSLLSDYLHHLYARCSSYASAAAAVYGTEFFASRLKGRLHSSRLALRGWKRIAPHRSYPPLTWDAACVIAVTLRSWGEHKAAIAVLLMFDCYLRIGEMAALRCCDIIDSSSVRMGSSYRGMSICIPKAKTGVNQSVDVRNSLVQRLIAAEIIHDDPHSRASAFGLTAAQFRRLFKRACATIGLSRDYVPHSLRHGGATKDYLDGEQVTAIIMRGRWASHRTASRYVQAGKAMLAARTDFPAAIGRLGARLSKPGILRAIFRTLRAAPTRA